jgi:hypothetical protein
VGVSLYGDGAVEQPVGGGGEERAAGRSARVARARELREIAAEMGVVTQTVVACFDDPDGLKLRERKQRYGGAARTAALGRAGPTGVPGRRRVVVCVRSVGQRARAVDARDHYRGDR